jgi:hypothetical protein
LKKLDISLSWRVFLRKFKKANSYHLSRMAEGAGITKAQADNHCEQLVAVHHHLYLAL